MIMCYFSEKGMIKWVTIKNNFLDFDYCIFHECKWWQMKKLINFHILQEKDLLDFSFLMYSIWLQWGNRNLRCNFILTDTIKKSWCNIETIPKLVNLNTLSIIHIKLGKTFGLALNVVINIGTSPVLWWFAITNVFSLIICCISSPCSITVEQKIIVL